MKRTSLFLSLCFALLLFACGSEAVSERQIYAMDTVCSISVYGDSEISDKIADRLYELEKCFSAYNGEVRALNDAGGGKMSPELSALLEKAVELQWETGTFWPILGSVIELWGVGEKNYIPTDEELSAALSSASMYNGTCSGDEIWLENGARLNFGAIAKGYAADEVRELLLREGVGSAVVSLGGNVYVHGKKPDGSLWRVGIRDPRGTENDCLGTLELSNSFVVSSGDYERYFERDGKRYHHIIDPKTGRPAESDLSAVAVISDEGARADAYSTALYIMGEEKALSFWRSGEGFELVLVCRDGRVVVTEGLSDKFTPDGEAGYTYETANR